MTRVIRLGVLVPSSNTALEPLTYEIISSIKDKDLQISVHFSRFRVTHIDLSAASNAQFKLETIIAAAQLLADAKVEVIGWSGTSAGWLGFDVDERLCKAIEAETGIKATTSVLALNTLLHKFEVKQLALVTPYTGPMNEAIRKRYATIGIEIPTDQTQCLGLTDNMDIQQVEMSTLDEMIGKVVENGAKVVTTFCTNLTAAQRVSYWEQNHNILVLDTVSTVIWDMLRVVGVKPGLVQGWGRSFDS